VPEIDPLYLFYGFAALAVVLAVEAIYLVFSSQRSYRGQVNRRLEVSAAEPDREKVLVQLRRERGLTHEGGFAVPLAKFNRLVLQSGVRLSTARVTLMLAGFAGAAFLGAFLVRGQIGEAAVAAVAAALGLPVLLLIWLRKRRQNRFGAQFPDAIDVIVRSLRAGHPVPVAISMVAREMPDPVGSEFGMIADEVTYGADLETALRAMMSRVGQEDIPLFVTSVAIQASTGGNLSEILDNLSKVTRERFKMRRKIRGLSAEGRASALILNMAPISVFAIINLISPHFYAETYKHQYGMHIFGGAIGWMMIGNLIMRRMINFKI
jgi:tight adherence protein B